MAVTMVVMPMTVMPTMAMVSAVAMTTVPMTTLATRRSGGHGGSPERDGGDDGE